MGLFWKLLLIPLVLTLFSVKNSFAVTLTGSSTTVSRDYLVYIPKNLPRYSKIPMVIMLHAGNSNAQELQSGKTMDMLADFYKFIVLYPNGTIEEEGTNKRTWNAGACCGVASSTNVDDMTFLSQLITKMKSDYNIDSNKVFMLGVSNGAMLGYKFICEKPGVIKSFVVVAGAFLSTSCASNPTFSVLAVHGENDDVLSPNGSTSTTGLQYNSIQQTGAILTNAGVSFRSIILKNTGHSVPEIETAIFAKYGQPLSIIAYDFMNNKYRKY